jgi:hypothetical protein
MASKYQADPPAQLNHLLSSARSAQPVIMRVISILGWLPQTSASKPCQPILSPSVLEAEFAPSNCLSGKAPKHLIVLASYRAQFFDVES